MDNEKEKTPGAGGKNAPKSGEEKNNKNLVRILSAVLLVLLPVFGWMLAITTSVLQMAVKAFHALCLCRTALFFRRWGGGAAERADQP